MAKAAVALIFWLCVAAPAFAAQPSKPAAIRPAWSDLTSAQQQILSPLAPDWESLDATRRKKWVSIANRYPKMKPAEQQRLQEQMKKWAALTPKQREEARQRYRTLTPEQRRAMSRQWQEYRRSLAQPETQFDPSVGEPPSSEASAEVMPAQRQ